MLLKPHIKLNRITDINLQVLKANNIKGLILDVDNTLSTHHGEVLVDGLQEWLSYMQKNGIKLIILSNSKEKRVGPFARRLGLDYFSLGLKPLPFGYLKSARKMGIKLKNTAIVGDQLFTDSLGGHLAGVKTIILNPIKPEEMWSFRVRRYLEKKLYKHYKFEV